jgi:hypothetical protein
MAATAPLQPPGRRRYKKYKGTLVRALCFTPDVFQLNYALPAAAMALGASAAFWESFPLASLRT